MKAKTYKELKQESDEAVDAALEPILAKDGTDWTNDELKFVEAVMADRGRFNLKKKRAEIRQKVKGVKDTEKRKEIYEPPKPEPKKKKRDLGK